MQMQLQEGLAVTKSATSPVRPRFRQHCLFSVDRRPQHPWGRCCSRSWPLSRKWNTRSSANASPTPSANAEKPERTLAADPAGSSKVRSVALSVWSEAVNPLRRLPAISECHAQPFTGGHRHSPARCPARPPGKAAPGDHMIPLMYVKIHVGAGGWHFRAVHSPFSGLFGGGSKRWPMGLCRSRTALTLSGTNFSAGSSDS